MPPRGPSLASAPSASCPRRHRTTNERFDTETTNSPAFFFHRRIYVYSTHCLGKIKTNITYFGQDANDDNGVTLERTNINHHDVRSC